MITALTVNYNTPKLLELLLKSFRQFYDIPYMVIDGSDEANYNKIKNFDKKYNIELIHVGYNIHHGPGMTYGISLINTDQILLVDSDMIILNGGWLEKMKKSLRPNSYGIGYVNAGRDERGYIEKYLHPVFTLVNRKVILNYPMPDKSGMPLVDAMRALKETNNLHLLQEARWLTEDLCKHKCLYVQHGSDHMGMGTINATGGYNY